MSNIIIGERLNLEEEGNDADENDQTINDSELSDALKGTTMTTLKLRIHELERELERLREGKPTDSDADSNLILQSMLDDANRMKERYEQVTIKFTSLIYLHVIIINIYSIQFNIHHLPRTMSTFKRKNYLYKVNLQAESLFLFPTI